MAMTDAEWVRLHTPDDVTALSNTTIYMFLDEYAAETEANRRKLATADCLEYLARDDVYESYSRGGISVGRNILRDRAAEYRASVGASVGTGTLKVSGWEAS